MTSVERDRQRAEATENAVVYCFVSFLHTSAAYSLSVLHSLSSVYLAHSLTLVSSLSTLHCQPSIFLTPSSSSPYASSPPASLSLSALFLSLSCSSSPLLSSLPSSSLLLSYLSLLVRTISSSFLLWILLFPAHRSYFFSLVDEVLWARSAKRI